MPFPTDTNLSLQLKYVIYKYVTIKWTAPGKGPA